MRIFSTPVRRGILLILLLNATPTYESMFNSYRPTWTSPGRHALKEGTGTYIRKIHFGAVFGVNVEPDDVHFKERWHRVRFGYPVSPITIDVEQRKKQVQGRIETNWLAIWFCISCILWMSIESMLALLSAVRARLRGAAEGRQ